MIYNIWYELFCEIFYCWLAKLNSLVVEKSHDWIVCIFKDFWLYVWLPPIFQASSSIRYFYLSNYSSLTKNKYCNEAVFPWECSHDKAQRGLSEEWILPVILYSTIWETPAPFCCQSRPGLRPHSPATTVFMGHIHPAKPLSSAFGLSLVFTF